MLILFLFLCLFFRYFAFHFVSATCSELRYVSASFECIHCIFEIEYSGSFYFSYVAQPYGNPDQVRYDPDNSLVYILMFIFFTCMNEINVAYLVFAVPIIKEL